MDNAKIKELNELFKESGLTLTEVARMSGVSLSTVHRYVRGAVKEINYSYYLPIYNALKKEFVEFDAEKLKNQMLSNAFEGTATTSSNQDVNEVEKEEKVENRGTSTAIQERSSSERNVQQSTYRVPKRGDIFYIRNTSATGSEAWGSRPAVIVSSDKLNECMSTVEVCYITSQPHKELPCHVTIKTDRDVSVVLCEQISTVSRSRIRNYYGSVSEEEMSMIESAMMASLGIKVKNVEVKHSLDYVKLQVELNFLRNFYEQTMKIKMLEAESYALLKTNSVK